MKKKTFETGCYEQPCCEVLTLTAETSFMLTTSGIEEGIYYEEDAW